FLSAIAKHLSVLKQPDYAAVGVGDGRQARYATGSRDRVTRSSGLAAAAASRAAASCSGGSSASRASSAGRAAKLYAGGSCSWPSAKVSNVAACSRSPISRRTAPTPLIASSSSEIAAEACACSSAAQNVRWASSTPPSASAAKPIRQRAVIVPHLWLTSEKAS